MKETPFDYLDLHFNKFYEMKMRVVRFSISHGSYECIITNLSQEKFSSDEIKQLYAKRWEIETSFRELKYALGLTRFHAKKPEYIVQEIWSRMILYNFCEIIATNAVVKQKAGCKHIYQLNHTHAMRIYCHFLVSNHQFNWGSKGLYYCSPQRAVSQTFLLVRYKVVLRESSLLDSSACSFIYFCTASSVILPIVPT